MVGRQRTIVLSLSFFRFCKRREDLELGFVQSDISDIQGHKLIVSRDLFVFAVRIAVAVFGERTIQQRTENLAGV